MSERLLQGLEARERGESPAGGEDVDELFADVRTCIEALGTRAVRPVMRSIDTSVDAPLDDERAAALASELGGARCGAQQLSFEELMSEFPDHPADGMALVEKLLLLGFERREYAALGVTHRYYCRHHESRAELRAQMMAWLASEG